MQTFAMFLTILSRISSIKRFLWN